MSFFNKLMNRRGAKLAPDTLESETKSTKVLVDGQEIDAADIDDDLLRQMVSELGVSPEKLAAIQVQEGANAVLRSAAAELAEAGASGPVERVECPECERTVVNRTGSCMYCGTPLGEDPAAAAETHSGASPVQEKLLEGDVATAQVGDEAAAKDVHSQPLLRT